MSPRKCEEGPQAPEATARPSLAAPGPTIRKAKTGACSSCRARKISCIFAPDETICIKCTEGGFPEECIIQESRTRSRSNKAPPSDLTSKPTARKRRASTTQLTTASHMKRQRRSSSQDPAHTRRHGLPAGDLNPRFDIEPEEDGYETKSQEDFDLEDVTADSDEDRSDLEIDDDNVSNLKPVQRGQGAPAKCAPPVKPIGKGSTSMKPASLYDPPTCAVFKIPCAVNPTQGGYTYPPAPVIVLPPWPGVGQGYHGGNGMLYQPSSYQMALPSHIAQAYPQPTICQPLATTPLPGSHGAAPLSDPSSPGSTVPVPGIIPWFNFLEKREKKPLHGVKFGDFGPILKRKGFVRISQLARDYIPVEKLQEWLGIEYGTAVLIFQHVESDMQAISSGQAVLPRDF